MLLLCIGTNAIGVPVGECPKEDGEFVTLLPDDEDYTVFYKCDWGVSVMQVCPDGLQFNVVLDVCDWPENCPPRNW